MQHRCSSSNQKQSDFLLQIYFLIITQIRMESVFAIYVSQMSAAIVVIPVWFSSFMTYYGVCNKDATCGAGTEFLYNAWQIVVCPFVVILLAIELYILLRVMTSDFAFGIFKQFFQSVKLKRLFISTMFSIFRGENRLTQRNPLTFLI